MAVQRWDRLNLLRARYEAYFSPMGIPEERKRLREELAVDLDAVILFALEMMAAEAATSGDIDEAYYTDYLYRKMLETAEPVIGELPDRTRAKLKERAAAIVETTAKRVEEAKAKGKKPDEITEGWEFSEGRAEAVAGNEAQWLCVDDEHRAAEKEGKTRKTWQTMADGRVRPTHFMVDGVTMPLDEPFNVGEYLMMYPTDISLGAGPEEVSNCRCWLVYS